MLRDRVLLHLNTLPRIGSDVLHGTVIPNSGSLRHVPLIVNK